MQYGWDFKYRDLDYFGVSLAGIRTSVLVRQLKLCLDVAQGLPHCMKAKTIAITHGHMDHAAGIPYVVSQMAMSGKCPTIYMPEYLIEKMHAIMKLWQEIDEFDYALDFRPPPLEPVSIHAKYALQAIPSQHRVPSFGYVVHSQKKSLKPEFTSLSRQEIISLRESGQELEESIRVPEMVFSGDTRIEFLDQPLVQKAKVVFLECTYIDQKKSVDVAREWGHIHIDELVDSFGKLECEKLVIKHVSARYRTQEIKSIISSRFANQDLDRIVVFEGR